jgi:hypothetical protein
VWQLVFEGKSAVIRHELGLVHVAWLLSHPGAEPVPALELAGRLAGARRGEKRGVPAGLADGVVVQQRSLPMDANAISRQLWRKQRQLETVLEDDGESEPVKAEAQRELETLLKVKSDPLRNSADISTRAAQTVRRSIRRLHRRLADAVDAEGRPHRILRAFAAHLETCVLVPSRRWAGARGSGAYPGCLVYEPPQGVRWICE